MSIRTFFPACSKVGVFLVAPFQQPSHLAARKGLAAEGKLPGQAGYCLHSCLCPGMGGGWLLRNYELAEYMNYLKHRSLCSQCCHWTSYSVFCVYMKSRSIHLATCIPISFPLKRSLLFQNMKLIQGLVILATPPRGRKATMLGQVILTEFRAGIPRGEESEEEILIFCA